MKGGTENSFLEHFSERFMDHVRQVCTFAKLVPGFKGLHHDDQVTLLKSCVFEVLLVRLSGLFENQVRPRVKQNSIWLTLNRLMFRFDFVTKPFVYVFLFRNEQEVTGVGTLPPHSTNEK